MASGRSPSTMHEMRGFLGSARPIYWALIALITVLEFWWGIAYKDPLWLQRIPVAAAALGALMVDRSWRGVSIVLGVTLLMYITYCLRHYGPYQVAGNEKNGWPCAKSPVCPKPLWGNMCLPTPLRGRERKGGRASCSLPPFAFEGMQGQLVSKRLGSSTGLPSATCFLLCCKSATFSLALAPTNKKSYCTGCTKRAVGEVGDDRRVDIQGLRHPGRVSR